jgi:hypothetical protein
MDVHAFYYLPKNRNNPIAIISIPPKTSITLNRNGIGNIGLDPGIAPLLTAVAKNPTIIKKTPAQNINKLSDM